MIEDLTTHFNVAELPQKISTCASHLENYVSSRSQSYIDAFRQSVEDVIKAAEISDPDLFQPYARQVIDELKLEHILPPQFGQDLRALIAEQSFDQATLITALKALSTEVGKKIDSIASIYNAFSNLEVEYERVQWEHAEIGFLLPREVVGETLKDLSSELLQINKLAKAVNELTAAPDYDPKILTISSSWWQIFLNLEPEQIIVWTIAIERIVGLFKSNLEIKSLQRQLNEKEMPQEIIKALDAEIEKRVSSSIGQLAQEIRIQHAKIDDEARLNEIQTQLRQGLNYLAKRLNQGSNVEINVGIPAAPTEPGENATPEDQLRIQTAKEKIQRLKDLRKIARAVSADTASLETGAPLLLTEEKHLDDAGNTAP